MPILSRARKREKGFTLVEIMIVVAIIAILAGVIIANYTHPKSNAEAGATQANLREIATALELYYQDYQQYPGTPATSTTALYALFGGANNKYLTNQPNSPGPGGGSYSYITDGNGDYTITDPAFYDVQTLHNLNKASSAPSGGTVSMAGTLCGTSCTHVGFSNTAGIFGY